MKKMFGIVASLLLLAVMPVALLAGPEDDPGSVDNYNINWAVQTGATEITVQVQARYCPACNPNSANNSGCTAFEHTLPPYGHRSCTKGYPDGRYTAVRIKDSGGTVLATQKMVCNPTNWPLNVVHTENFIFTGVPLSAGDTVTVEADTYCSWCGHWYPDPITLTVEATDSLTTYTGDTLALVGTSANVSATLEDVGTGDPLAGRTITFTLDSLSVSAVTDSNGIAATLLFIPDTMAAGIYSMTARFAGDAEYFPSSDTVDFEVIIVIEATIEIKPETLNLSSKGVFTAFIDLPEGYNEEDIDINTIECEWAPALKGMMADDGRLIVKFDREDLGYVPTGDAVELTVTGELTDGTPFEGSDTIRVIDKGK